MAVVRPLTSEPLPLDLVNTVWLRDGRPYDLFSRPETVQPWLAGHELQVDGPIARVKENLVTTREAIRAVLTSRADGPARLNEVLSRGSRSPRWGDGAVTEVDIVDDESWRSAWRCAAAFVELWQARGTRIHKCSNPPCLLWYVDVSRNGSRRWCSMDSCGNRAKAGRFYQRGRALGAAEGLASYVAATDRPRSVAVRLRFGITGNRRRTTTSDRHFPALEECRETNQTIHRRRHLAAGAGLLQHRRRKQQRGRHLW